MFIWLFALDFQTASRSFVISWNNSPLYSFVFRIAFRTNLLALNIFHDLDLVVFYTGRFTSQDWLFLYGIFNNFLSFELKICSIFLLEGFARLTATLILSRTLLKLCSLISISSAHCLAPPLCFCIYLGLPLCSYHKLAFPALTKPRALLFLSNIQALYSLSMNNFYQYLLGLLVIWQ